MLDVLGIRDIGKVYLDNQQQASASQWWLEADVSLMPGFGWL